MKKLIRFTAFFALFSQVSKSQTPLCFNSPVNYVTANTPSGIITADFDLDSKPDMAIASGYSNSVSILLNGGGGTFNAAVNYVTGERSYGIVSADFNGDGKPDLAVANYGHLDYETLVYVNSTVSILLNTGGGNFAAAVNYGPFNPADKIISEDFNQDGTPDLAVTNYFEKFISVMLGTGTGTFGAIINYPLLSTSKGVVSADFNGDSKLDLAVCSQTGSISILNGSGSGTFSTPTVYPIQGLKQAVEMNLGDFNGDGNKDLIITDVGSNSLFVGINTGGTFNQWKKYNTTARPNFTQIADLNLDGKLDLAVSIYQNNNVSVLLNDGSGTFGSAISYTVGKMPVGVSCADFNGDGKPDLAVTNNSDNNVSVLLNCPTPVPPTANYSNLPTSVCLGSTVNADPSISGTPPQTFYLSNPLLSPQADTALSVCKNNHSVFALFAGDSVRRYDYNGNYQFTYPYLPLGSHAIAADNSDRLYVVGPDNLNPAISQITRLDATGNYDFTFWNSGPTTDNYILNYIAGIAVGPDGNLYAADTLADIKVLTTDNSSQISSIAAPSNSQYSLYKPMGICFGKGGQMYVADAGNHNILMRNQSDNNFYPAFPNMSATWEANSVDVDTARNNLYFTTRNTPQRVVMAHAVNSFGDTLCTYDTLSSHVTFASPNSLAVTNQNSWPNLWVSDNKSTTLNRINKFIYTIKPTLPAGLIFQAYGGITGVPTGTVALTTYTVIVSNSVGTDSSTFSFAVDPPGPVSNSTGTLTASGDQSDGLTIHYFNSNNCAKMLQIADSVGGGMPGVVTVTQTVTPTISVFNADTFINRVTEITAQDGTDSAVITIYYTYLDIQHYNQSMGQTILSNDTVGGTMKVAVLQMHESPPNTGHVVPIKHGPLPATWSHTEHHWVVNFGIKRFSTFYLGDTTRVASFQCVNSHLDSIVTTNNYYIWHSDTIWATGIYADTLWNHTGCDSVCTLKLTINQTTGITPALDKGVSVYPNPSTGILNINVNDPNVDIKKIRIVNMIGEEIYVSDNKQRDRKIDLGGLPKGFYFVTIISGQENLTKKILIE